MVEVRSPSMGSIMLCRNCGAAMAINEIIDNGLRCIFCGYNL